LQFQVRTTSLLQLKTGRGIQDPYEDRQLPSIHELEGELLDSSTGADLQLTQQLASLDNAGDALASSSLDSSQAASATTGSEVVKLMQSAAFDAKKAQLSVDADAAKAAHTAHAMENALQNNQDARVALTWEAKKAAEAGEALTGALQRVQRAGEVESRELAMEAVATRRLQEAARGAKQVQALEDEGAAREARAAQLLEQAVQKLESTDDEDASSPLRETLRVVEEAQKAVAAEASHKVRVSQLLQSSLEGAATAVETIQRGKEAQTSKWLRDALSNLQWMQSSWGQRTEAEEKVAKHLDDAVKSTDSAEKLSEESSANKGSVAALMQDTAQKVHSAQSVVAQEESKNALAQKREAQNSRALQEALKLLQNFERSGQMPNQPLQMSQMSAAQDQARAGQLATYLQGLMQNVKASNDVQQVQLAQVMQQINQAMSNQPASGLRQQIPGVAGVGQLPPSFQAMPQETVQMGSQMAPLNNYMQGAFGAQTPPNALAQLLAQQAVR